LHLEGSVPLPNTEMMQQHAVTVGRDALGTPCTRYYIE
jgi:hypothetical protein